MNNRLEQYLEQVERRLRALPAMERQNELREMRDHMEALVQAHRELGASEEEAIALTLAQFGNAKTVGAELTRALRRTNGPLPDNLLLSALCTYACMWVGGLALFYCLLVVRNNGLHPRFFGDLPVSGMLALLIGSAVFLCFTAGCVTGAAFPQRAARGAALAYLVFFAIQLYSIYHRHGSLPTHGLWYFSTCGSHVLAASVTIFGAKTGAHWRRINSRRRSSAAGPQSA